MSNDAPCETKCIINIPFGGTSYRVLAEEGYFKMKLNCVRTKSEAFTLNVKCETNAKADN
eukprot:1875855-Heterocapsa_arctica.AAC.1